MARRGRPRKPGKRKPCGRRSDSVVHAEQKRNDVRCVVLEQPHRRWLEGEHRRDQRAESEIGRLFLAGRISEANYWAADRWRSIIAQFHIVLATPMNTGTALGRVVTGGGDEDAWKRGESGKNERAETEVEMRARVLGQYDAAMTVLRQVDDAALVFTIMEEVILRDQPCTERGLILMQRGLAALCRRWKISDPRPGEEPPVRVLGTEQDKLPWSYEEKEVHIVYAGD